MSKIYVLHENNDWTAHLEIALQKINAPYELWHINEGSIPLHDIPPEGVFFSRMSASAHTRGHRYAPELTGAIFAWLDQYGRKVFNGKEALALELSKVAQYAALEKEHIRTPKTIAAVGKKQIIEAGKSLQQLPFIIKHNRAGKGLGVHLFHSIAELKQHVNSEEFEPSIDGITLVQQYIDSPNDLITRVEFVGGKLLYAVNVDTSEGFELCPAEACRVPSSCSVDESNTGLFSIRENVDENLIMAYEQFLQKHQIHVAGIEFIEDRKGNVYTYDINTNTNYNPNIESEQPKKGMQQVASFLLTSLQEQYNKVSLK